MPNNFAYFVLILWPFISLFIYKRLPIIPATFWTIVGGFLLLPSKTAIDFPFIPPLNKESITVIAALIGCRYIKKIKITLIPKEGIERWFILILLITPFITMINNQETYNFIPGLTLHDTISAIVNQYLKLLPLILGMQLIKTHEDQLVLFKLLVVAGLIYSLPILFEVRMSPQLHTWIYGFFPHGFGQQMRGDGFRSIVFLGHGLIVAMFVAITLGAATILMKEKISTLRLHPWLVVFYFMVVLVFCKTMGALILGIVLLLSIAWMPINLIRRISLVIIFIVVMYPMLSIFDLFPHQKLIELATDINPLRGESLAFRFHHENLLLQHAEQKIFFGWGSWGRNRLDESVTDGYWIILFGQYGLFGFLSMFGLAMSSIWKGIKHSNYIKDKSQKNLLVYYALLVSVIMVDQIPNASLAAWLLFLIGGLLGRAQFLKKNSKNEINILQSKGLRK